MSIEEDLTSFILPAIKKGLTLFNYKVLMLIINEEEIIGLFVRRFLSRKDMVLRLLFGFVGAMIGRLLLGGSSGGENFGTVAGAAAFSNILDEEIEERTKKILEKGVIKGRNGAEVDVLLPISMIKYAELKYGERETCVLKIKTGWRGMEFILRRTDGVVLAQFLTRLLKDRFRNEICKEPK